MIDFSNVGFTYDGETFVLDDISFNIERGEFVAILGGNGSGKSTLAKHINALLLPDRGRVCVLNASTAEPDNLYFIRSNAGMVFQNPDDQLVASLVENDVAFGPENLGIPSLELRKLVTESLAQVGLQGFEKTETTALSGGQKQRVAIAGILAMEPEILILDEASAMLDPRGRRGLLKVCHSLHDAGMTIVMITHFMEEAALADRILVIDDGHLVMQGTPDDVLTRVDELEKLSLEVPFAVKMSRALQQRGVPVATHVTESTLAADILRVLGAGRHAQQVAHDYAAQAAGETEGDEATHKFASGKRVHPLPTPPVPFEGEEAVGEADGATAAEATAATQAEATEAPEVGQTETTEAPATTQDETVLAGTAQADSDQAATATQDETAQATATTHAPATDTAAESTEGGAR
jgi:energy-coupling factor transport system ATP-binding protein